MSRIRTRKRGKTFSYIFEAGRKDDGKRKVIEKGGFATRELAYTAGVSAYNDWKHGNIGITSDSITVKEFIKNWIENVVALNVKPTSMQIYNSIVRKHIFPTLGSLKLQELTPAILDKWIRGLLKAGYSKNTISVTHTLIHHALDYAVYPAEMIANNPANYIKVPQKAPKNIVKRQIISKEKLCQLLAKYPFGTPYYMPILILFCTGLRISEMLGLTWEDINFDKKVISLKKQIIYLSKKGYYFSTLKTESSNRFIVIDDFLAEELLKWKNQQIENEKSAGDSYVCIYRGTDGRIIQQSKGIITENENVNLVCTRKDGRAVSKGSITHLLKKENLNAHSFRHTHATMLIENGATPKGVAGRLGHSNANITQNLYTHNTEKLQSDTAKIFSQTMQTKT